jgi:hypothetical protein
VGLCRGDKRKRKKEEDDWMHHICVGTRQQNTLKLWIKRGRKKR